MDPGEDSSLRPEAGRGSVRLPLALVVGVLILLVASLVANLAQVLGRIDVPPDVPLVAGVPLEPESIPGGADVVPAAHPLDGYGHRHQQEPVFW